MIARPVGTLHQCSLAWWACTHFFFLCTWRFFSPIAASAVLTKCVQYFCVTTPPPLRPALLQQMDMGSLPCAELWVRSLHTEGSVCTRVGLAGGTGQLSFTLRSTVTITLAGGLFLPMGTENWFVIHRQVAGGRWLCPPPPKKKKNWIITTPTPSISHDNNRPSRSPAHQAIPQGDNHSISGLLA